MEGAQAIKLRGGFHDEAVWDASSIDVTSLVLGSIVVCHVHPLYREDYHFKFFMWWSVIIGSYSQNMKTPTGFSLPEK